MAAPAHAAPAPRSRQVPARSPRAARGPPSDPRPRPPPPALPGAVTPRSGGRGAAPSPCCSSEGAGRCAGPRQRGGQLRRWHQPAPGPRAVAGAGWEGRPRWERASRRCRCTRPRVGTASPSVIPVPAGNGESRRCRRPHGEGGQLGQGCASFGGWFLFHAEVLFTDDSCHGRPGGSAAGGRRLCVCWCN